MGDSDSYDMADIDIAWCPGCGNFGILQTLKKALGELEVEPKDLVLVSGIGQAAKIPHYLKCNVFNGLHGRALPPATAIKAVNPDLLVIAESGDGDMFGEGGNHMMHAIRRNPDIVNIVHDNMVYGLTKGQASPTSRIGFKTPVQVNGVFLKPFNPISFALSMGAGFIARGYSKRMDLTADLIKQAIEYRGYAMIDLLQPCVTFNKLNTYQWFEEHTYDLDDSHDPSDLEKAFKLSMEQDPLPLGVIYKAEEGSTFNDGFDVYQEDDAPLWKRKRDLSKMAEILENKR